MTRRKLRCRTLGCGVSVLFALAGPADAAPDLAAFESAPVVIVGQVRAAEALGGAAWRVRVAVDEWWAQGPPSADGAANADRVAVVFERPGRSADPGLGVGDRVLAALEPLRLTTAWRSRLGAEAPAGAWTFADRGRARVVAPAVGSIEILRHFLRLPRAARDGPDGVRHLLALASGAAPPLAGAAARRLAAGAPAAVPVALSPEQAALVVQGLSRPGPDVSPGLLSWVAEGRPAGLAAALEAAIRVPGAAAAVFAARAELPGGLPETTLRALVHDAREPVRLVAARYARAASAGLLRDLISHDPSPAVRAAALGRHTAVAFDAAVVLGAFADEDARVRGAAAQLWAQRPDAAVAPIRARAFGRVPRVAQTAVLTLRLMDRPEATRVLGEVAREHPSAELRALARMALHASMGEVQPGTD